MDETERREVSYVEVEIGILGGTHWLLSSSYPNMKQNQRYRLCLWALANVDRSYVGYH